MCLFMSMGRLVWQHTSGGTCIAQTLNEPASSLLQLAHGVGKVNSSQIFTCRNCKAHKSRVSGP